MGRSRRSRTTGRRVLARPYLGTTKNLRRLCLRRIAHDSRHSLASAAEAEWLISAAGPLLDELAQRRSVMAEWPVQPVLDNVIILPAVR